MRAVARSAATVRCGRRTYTPFSQRPARVTLSVASLVRVRFLSSRRMATLTTPMIPASTPAANRLMAANAIMAAIADPPFVDCCLTSLSAGGGGFSIDTEDARDGVYG